MILHQFNPFNKVNEYISSFTNSEEPAQSAQGEALWSRSIYIYRICRTKVCAKVCVRGNQFITLYYLI